MSGPLRTIDLNADLGEGFPNDEALLDLVTSASVSCGAHAGDRTSIVRTLRAAKSRGTRVGAHPGYADRDGFGRREQAIGASEAEALVLDQCAALSALAAEAGVALGFVKPHGALYNQAQREPEVAAGIVAAVARLGLPVLGQPSSALESAARAAGVRYIAEGFPDRRYGPEGRLLPRTEPGAVLHEPAEIEAHLLDLVARGLDTLCIHGDDPRAVANAQLVRAVLARHAIDVKGCV